MIINDTGRSKSRYYLTFSRVLVVGGRTYTSAIYVYIYMHMRVYIYMYLDTHVCIYIYMYILMCAHTYAKLVCQM